MITRGSIKGAFPTKPLGDLVDFLDHMRRPITAKDRVPGPIPYYGANGQQDSVADFLFDEPLILVAEDGGHFDDPDRGIAYRISGRSWVNNHAHVLRPRGQVDLPFLCRFLENYDVRPYISGTTRGKLTKGQAAKIEVPLPPLAEQRRIAAILDHADALRRLRRQFLSKSDTLMTSVVERAEGKDGKLVPLSESFWFQEGPGVRNWQFVDDGVKLLNVSNVTKENRLEPDRSKNRVSFEEARGKYAHFLVDAGDLIMPCSGIPIAPDGFLATRSAFAEAHHLPLCMNTSTIRFKALRTEGDLIFLQGWLQTLEFRKQITKLVTGTAQKNFGPSHLKQLKITLPSLATVETLKREMLVVDKLRQVAVAAMEALDKLFTSLQHRAFRGEL